MSDSNDPSNYDPWDKGSNKIDFMKKRTKTDEETKEQNKGDENPFLFFEKAKEKSFFSQFSNFFEDQSSLKKPKNRSGGKGGGSRNPSSNNLPLYLIPFTALVFWLSSGVFRVQETDYAVILRLGKIHRFAGPGLHFRIPSPFEQEIIKNVSSNNVMSSTSRVPYNRGAAEDKSDQTLVLTGDENIIHISYTVTWKIRDLAEYLFTMRNPNSTILAATESIMREVIGQTDALSALTEERSAISQKASERLQEVLNEYKIGVDVVQVQLQKVEPPTEVINAFNDMQASLTDGDGLRIKAEAYKSEVIPKARGDAQKIVQEAEGYAKQITTKAQGEAERFQSVYMEYKKNPEVAKKRLYINALEQILSKTPKTLVDSKVGSGILPYMNVSPHVLDQSKGG